MTRDVRLATADDVATAATIAAEGFFADPLMQWVFPDATTRLEYLRPAFTGLATSFLDDRSVLQLCDDACVTMWRGPDFDWTPTPPGEDANESPYPPDVQERFRILGELMAIAHPHDRVHWYLNVIATLPSRQGQGLGATTLQPMIDRCDKEQVPAYLESSNPRNMTLYRRCGFEDINDPIQMPDGPALYPMWREPR